MMTMELKESDFQKISRLVYEQCGINLHDGKKELVKARLGKRLRRGNFSSFSDYYRYVTTDEGQDELVMMIDSLSTNLTYFFRESGHFRKLRSVLPDMAAVRNEGRKNARLQIWSAGCSSGEEPYSLAITAKELLGENAASVAILATDISTRVLAAAIRGIFPRERMRDVSDQILKRYFRYGSGKWAGFYQVKKEIRDMVRFLRFNLMDFPPADFASDVIFCRNVMIYFDKPTQEMLVNRLYQTLNKGGYLFVGHSESLTGLTHPFNYIEPSVYRK
ncbi:MAG TPA: protein-glutamate O-methyltransferase [Syntrophales bacterium]|nr:protein-glutamate O-methyltransferase [Syntrophales bacterium]HQA81896.1 protein-glutamate O-methyltransferase [Syntrophales bacterium]